jgi:hypothetical protein
MCESMTLSEIQYNLATSTYFSAACLVLTSPNTHKMLLHVESTGRYTHYKQVKVAYYYIKRKVWRLQNQNHHVCHRGPPPPPQVKTTCPISLLRITICSTILYTCLYNYIYVLCVSYTLKQINNKLCNRQQMMLTLPRHRICRGSVLSYTWYCNYFLDFDYVWYIINFAILHFKIMHIRA